MATGSTAVLSSIYGTSTKNHGTPLVRMCICGRVVDMYTFVLYNCILYSSSVHCMICKCIVVVIVQLIRH